MLAPFKQLLRPLHPWWGLLKSQPKPLLLGAFLMLLTALAALGLLALSGWFITATALAGLILAVGGGIMLDVYMPGGGIRFFALLRTVARYGERLYNHNTVLQLLAEIRTLLFSLLAKLPIDSLRQHRSADWLNRLTRDIDALDSLYLRLLAPPVVAGLAVLAVAILLSFVHLPAAMVVVVAGWTLLAWLVGGQSLLGLQASRRHTQTLADLRSTVIEHCEGLAELESYGSLATHQATITQNQRDLHHSEQQLLRLTALGNGLSSLVLSGILLLALILGVLAYEQGLIAGPLAVMMPLGVLALNEAFANLPASFTRFGHTLASAERLNQIGRAAERQRTQDSRPTTFFPLRLQAISLQYPQMLSPTLSVVSLTIQHGQTVAILGASGVGKSTLLNLLLAELHPSSGAIYLAETPLSSVNRAYWYQNLAVLTQATDLFDTSIAENLRLAKPDASDADLMVVLRLVELDEWVLGLEQGLNSTVGEQGAKVSGGQARRLCLARTLLRVPQAVLIVLDEPFNGVDALMAQRIAERLTDYWAEKTLVLFLHQLEDWPLTLNQKYTLI